MPFPHCVCAQSHPTLCDPMDWSLQGCSVHGTLQARILQWVPTCSLLQGVSPTQRSKLSLQYLLHWQETQSFLRAHVLALFWRLLVGNYPRQDVSQQDVSTHAVKAVGWPHQGLYTCFPLPPRFPVVSHHSGSPWLKGHLPLGVSPTLSHLPPTSTSTSSS